VNENPKGKAFLSRYMPYSDIRSQKKFLVFLYGSDFSRIMIPDWSALRSREKLALS
jgi:hypothetical protein